MTHLTEEETLVLRATLGLSYWNRETPTRNRLDNEIERTNAPVVEKLYRRGYMKPGKVFAPGGEERHWIATVRGIEAVRDQPFKD
jgi:hypothetical protein